MAQAITLTKEEMTRVLDFITTRKYAARNRAMMLLTHLAGLRIGEVACLRWSDVMNLDGTVKDEIRLLPEPGPAGLDFRAAEHAGPVLGPLPR